VVESRQPGGRGTDRVELGGLLDVMSRMGSMIKRYS